MRACWGALLPSVIAVCLPMLELKASAAETVTVPDGSGTWEMTISPEVPEATGSLILLASAQDTPAEGAVPEPVEPSYEVDPAPSQEAGEPLPRVRPAASVDPAAYWAVYRSIPFIRTEYAANPSYRHEAAMAFLFGEYRPATVHRHVHYGAAPAGPPAVVPPWVYDRYLGQIPTFIFRYFPPAIPFNSYPVSW